MNTDYQLEKIEFCPLCNSPKRKQWNHQAELLMAVSCDSCNLVYMNNRLTEDGVARYYSNYNDNRNTVNPDMLEKRRKMYKMDRSFVEMFIHNGSVLDYGGSSGDFVASLSPSIRKFVFDIDEAALNVGRQRHQEVKFYHDLSELNDGQLFDALIFRGTLQYQRDLKKIVEFCHLHLKEKGYLIFLATPNADGPAARLQRESWVLFNCFEHLYYFTVDTVSTLFSDFDRVYFDFPYIGTPYENRSNDLDKFIALCRDEEHQAHFPFWGSMMNVVLRK